MGLDQIFDRPLSADLGQPTRKTVLYGSPVDPFRTSIIDQPLSLVSEAILSVILTPSDLALK